MTDSAIALRVSRVRRTAPWLVVAWLLASALAKLLSGYSGKLAISAPVYFGMAYGELTLALCITLGGRPRKAALITTVALCAGGSIWAHWFAQKPCGCFGSRWLLDNATHAALNAILGILSLWILVEKAPLLPVPPRLSESS